MFFTPTPMSTHTDPDADTDKGIRQTDNDAALARLSAVQKGYVEDAYIQYFVPPRAQMGAARPPLINVGTYLRGRAIDDLVDGWLGRYGKEGGCQIVSLGAGSDTRFWRVAVRILVNGGEDDNDDV